jgi:hypothetical protein
MPHKAKANHYNCLNHVTTLAGAARMYYRDPKTVRYAIDTNNLAAVRDGRVWLVSIPSLVALWGEPPASRSNR